MRLLLLFYCLKNCPNCESVSVVTWNSDTIMCPCMMLMGHSPKTTCLTKNTNNAVLCLECLCLFHLVPFDSCDRILKQSTRLKCCDAHAVIFSLFHVPLRLCCSCLRLHRSRYVYRMFTPVYVTS